MIYAAGFEEEEVKAQINEWFVNAAKTMEEKKKDVQLKRRAVMDQKKNKTQKLTSKDKDTNNDSTDDD